MPEGHVLHRLASELNTHFAGTSPTVSSPQGRFAAEAATLTGHRMQRAEAWGKHLFIDFDAPSHEHIVHIHLGLIGSLRFEAPDATWGAIRLRIEGPTIAANLRGPQWCRLLSDEDKAASLRKLGADPLQPNPPQLPEVRAKVGRSRRSIASLLIDQQLFAGVGNIYRAESLFRLGIDPTTPGRELQHFDALWEDLVGLMHEGVRVGRIDTVRPEHTPEAMGRPPRKDDHGGEVYVYRREGQPCLVCGTPISAAVLEGRNLFWCPRCQRGTG